MPPAPQEPGREPEIATGTLAEIYAQQGLYERALEIYRRIERRRPDDPVVRARIEELTEALEWQGEEGEAAPETGIAEREFPEPGPARPAEPEREPERPAAPEAASAESAETAEEAPAEPEPGPEPEPGSGGAPPLEDDDAFRRWLEGRS